MTPLEVMHETFGEYPEENGKKVLCSHCHFFHWKIEGKKENRHQAYRWCEIYGLNKKDVTATDWHWTDTACGWFNECKYPDKKNLYKRMETK